MLIKRVDAVVLFSFIQIKAMEQNFHVVLFIMLNKVVLTFNSVDQTGLQPFK